MLAMIKWKKLKIEANFILYPQQYKFVNCNILQKQLNIN